MARSIVALLIVSTADLVLPFLQTSSGLAVAVSQHAARSSSSTSSSTSSLIARIPNLRRGSKPALGNLSGLCKASQSRESSQQDARLRKAGLRKRHVELLDGSKLFVVEAAKTSDMVEQWIENQMATTDPFGVVLWPAAHVISSQISSGDGVGGKTVLEVGCGTGLCSLSAAINGASEVISTDTNPQPLDLLDIAAEMQGVSVTTMLLDIGCDPKGVPPHDVLIAADCMYNDQVARALARLCHRSWKAGAELFVADSVNIARDSFRAELDRLECDYAVGSTKIDFTGSAVGIDEDVSRSPEVAIFKFAKADV